MAKGDNQRGKARAPKIKKLTQQQQQQSQAGSGAIRGMRKIVKGGIVKWVPKNQ